MRTSKRPSATALVAAAIFCSGALVARAWTMPKRMPSTLMTMPPMPSAPISYQAPVPDFAQASASKAPPAKAMMTRAA